MAPRLHGFEEAKTPLPRVFEALKLRSLEARDALSRVCEPPLSYNSYIEILTWIA